MKISDNQIDSITSYFTDKPVIRAFVFGSYARGDADEQSDIDLMVELEPDHSLGLAFFRMAGDIGELLHAQVDLVTADGLSPYIAPIVEKEKVLIYEKH